MLAKQALDTSKWLLSDHHLIGQGSNHMTTYYTVTVKYTEVAKYIFAVGKERKMLNVKLKDRIHGTTMR